VSNIGLQDPTLHIDEAYMRSVSNFLPTIGILATTFLVAACQTNPLLVVRTSCPAVAVVKNTGTLTRFSGAARTQEQIEFTASISGVSTACVDSSKPNSVTTNASFDIVARRPDAKEALNITLPYFVVVMNEGTKLLAKEVYEVELSFAPGQERASVRASLSADTPRLPPPPKAPKGAADAPPPPRGQFEVLLGFQLNERDIVYNITR
jgi:hypothetical protein